MTQTAPSQLWQKNSAFQPACWVDGSKQNANAQAKVSILQERSARMNAQELLRLRKEVVELKLDNELL
ncbi:hypothetical protein AKL15_02050 [Corynebacterium glutamicum]|nr:hypothetical protein AUO96_09585 [Corynebacterium glutamicum]QDX74622.1 hypothetical protein AKL15_02050 [Corynebacterium glutamicum]QDX77384.1 hypothetical protein AKL16_02055 [Corynebacterium glutamicum]TWS34491.1 hypothetical protein AKJ19_08300 [Corynebacterium glutamicum]TWS38045.1 hypothetical protein AKJ20_00295 [Corynebacterium glutamicum]